MNFQKHNKSINIKSNNNMKTKHFHLLHIYKSSKLSYKIFINLGYYHQFLFTRIYFNVTIKQNDLR